MSLERPTPESHAALLKLNDDLSSFNQGNHDRDGVWISDVNEHLFYNFRLCLTIVNRGKWLGSLVSIKEANEQTKIYVGRSLTLHIFCFMLIDYA